MLREDKDGQGAIVADRTVRIERLLPGPIERVWAYLTDSEKRRQWLAAGTMELQPSGRVEHLFRHQELSSALPCERTRRERNRKDVVAGSPPQVLNHFAVTCSAERDDAWHVSRIASDEHDVARVREQDVGAARVLELLERAGLGEEGTGEVEDGRRQIHEREPPARESRPQPCRDGAHAAAQPHQYGQSQERRREPALQDDVVQRIPPGVYPIGRRKSLPTAITEHETPYIPRRSADHQGLIRAGPSECVMTTHLHVDGFAIPIAPIRQDCAGNFTPHCRLDVRSKPRPLEIAGYYCSA